MPTITNATQVGGILKSRRKQLELSQAQVAEKLDLSQNRLSELEAHPDTLTLQQLIAMLNVLGLRLTIADRASASKSKVEW
jgi:HTH-type transcriptional regulator / antitoxin HipB